MKAESVRDVLNATWVKPKTRDRIRDAFEALVKQGRGPSKITASRALAKGWVSPFAWDSIDNDQEPATVESYRPTVDDLAHEIDGLVEAGESPEQVAKAVNRNIHYLERAMWKHGRPDLASFFYHARKRAAA